MAAQEGLVFRPTLAEVKGTSFEAYVRSIEPQLARVGIAKIVAPAGWTPRAKGYADVDYLVPKPVRQMATGRTGLYRTCLLEEKELRVAGRGGFAEKATAADAQAPGGEGADVDALERAFWKNVCYQPPLYGADVEGSLFDAQCSAWNVGSLGTLLTRTLRGAGAHIPGLTSPYLYFGSWRALFAWHTEDYDLYSVNYLHYGAPKTWYCVAPQDRARFETAARGCAPELFRHCPEFLRHKELLLSPQLLRSLGVPFTRITQRVREFVVTYPAAYHAGFNHGYNCAESTNFATPAWVPYGARARSCFCAEGTVHIDMRIFGVAPSQPRRRKRGAQGDAADADEQQTPPKALRATAPLQPPQPLASTPVFPVLHGSPLCERRLSVLGASAAAALPFVWKLAGVVVRKAGEAGAAAGEALTSLT